MLFGTPLSFQGARCRKVHKVCGLTRIKKGHLVLLCAYEAELFQVSQSFISSMSYFKMLIRLLFIFLTAARDGWALSWRVLHHIQAS